MTARASCSTTTTSARSCTSRASRRASPLTLRGLRFLERATFRTADRVTSTNESYRRIAMRRGGKAPYDVTRRPHRARSRSIMKPVAPVPSERRGRPHLVAYLGVMGPQDGVDVVLAAADHIVHALGRTDISFTLMGSGDCHDGPGRRA